MIVYGYARATAESQSLDEQVKQLRAAGAVSVFRDEVGAKSRDGQSELREALRTLKRGDMLSVTRLDRLASSLCDFLRIVEEIKDAGAGFRSLADNDMTADPNTRRGRLVLSVLTNVAAFDRCLVMERMAQGRGGALSTGLRFGRRPKLTDDQKNQVLQRMDAGLETNRAIARSLDVSHSMLSRWTLERVTRSKALRPGTKPSLDPQTEKAAKTFLKHIESRYAPLDVLVYGSRARGTHRADSDADIAVILKGKRGDRSQIGMEMAGIAVDVLDETGILVSALPLWEEEFKRPALFSNPALIEAIRREGLRP